MPSYEWHITMCQKPTLTNKERSNVPSDYTVKKNYPNKYLKICVRRNGRYIYLVKGIYSLLIHITFCGFFYGKLMKPTQLKQNEDG